MVRWAFKAGWTPREAALLLNEIDPEMSKFSPDDAEDDPVNAMLFWLRKEIKYDRLRTIQSEEDGQLRSTPGDIIRHLSDHKMTFSKTMEDVWAVVRYRENIRGRLADISWAIYEQAKNILVNRYDKITKGAGR